MSGGHGSADSTAGSLLVDDEDEDEDELSEKPIEQEPNRWPALVAVRKFVGVPFVHTSGNLGASLASAVSTTSVGRKICNSSLGVKRYQ